MDRSVARPQRRSWTAWLLNNGARLWVWYLILTIAFRCPSSKSILTADSPRACSAYLDAKDRLAPVIQPYYTAYAAPYVGAARPYYDIFYSNFYSPASAFATTNYHKYAAPQVLQIQSLSQRQWDRSVAPQLAKAQAQTTDLYDRSLGPYVGEVYDAARPHLETARHVCVRQYHAVIVPTLQMAQPYAQSAYDQGYAFTTEVGIPYGYWAGNAAITFIQRRVWPPVRILYGENIQPQLAKIQERLASYKDGKRLESVVESVDAAQSTSSASSSSASSAVAASSSSDAASSTSPETHSTESKITSKETANAEDYAGELKAWQEKFSKAAERGAADLRDRIKDITDKQIEQQAKGTAEALLRSLDEVTAMALEHLKPEVIKVIQDMPQEEDEPTESGMEAAEQKIRDEVRSAGKQIKGAAQRLRAWRMKYNEDTEKLINTATESTLEVVNNIRDLGLQEIGMRWAHLDGVSYRDWSEYHDMKRTFADWRSTVQAVVEKHQGPQVANAAGEEVEHRGMVIAENAAKELARLKDVSIWKLEAHDSGDDFSTRYSPPGAARAAQRAKQRVLSASSEYLGTSSSSTGVAESAASEASSYVKPAADQASSLASDASSKASSAAEAIAGSATKSASSLSSESSKDAKPRSRSSSSRSSKASSVASAAESSASSSASSVSSLVASSASSASSKMSSGASVAADAAASAASDASSTVEDAPSSASSLSSRLRASAKSAGGAAEAASEEMAAASIKSRLDKMRSSANQKAARFAANKSPSGTVDGSGISQSASSAASSVRSAVSSEGSSVASAHDSAQLSKSRESSKSKAKTMATQAASDMSKKASDIVDSASKQASAASESVASMVNEAGEQYTDVTSRLEL